MLPRPLLENVLAQSGLMRIPDPTLGGLRTLYSAWCREVPFDNVRKLIHLQTATTGPMPGSTPEDFFTGWLKYRTGGTCWPGAAALHSLLVSLGFDAARGIGTMMAAPNLQPNHGTVRVTLDTEHYLVDNSILHGEPLRFSMDADTEVAHAAWGVQC